MNWRVLSRRRGASKRWVPGGPRRIAWVEGGRVEGFGRREEGVMARVRFAVVAVARAAYDATKMAGRSMVVGFWSFVLRFRGSVGMDGTLLVSVR